MPLSSLEGAKKIVGTKQTIKALGKGLAKKVFIASDAEQHVIKPILTMCQERDIPVEMIDTMKDLGKACGIEVGCACAALVRE